MTSNGRRSFFGFLVASLVCSDVLLLCFYDVMHIRPLLVYGSGVVFTHVTRRLELMDTTCVLCFACASRMCCFERRPVGCCMGGWYHSIQQLWCTLCPGTLTQEIWAPRYVLPMFSLSCKLLYEQEIRMIKPLHWRLIRSMFQCLNSHPAKWLPMPRLPQLRFVKPARRPLPKRCLVRYPGG